MYPISEEQLIGFNKMVRRLPKELAFEDALQIRPLLKFFKNCREIQEEIKVLYTKALSTPTLKVLPKVDDLGKFIFPCSITGTTFKDALCDSEKLKVVPEKEHGDKGESRLLSDEDPCTDPTKFRGNSRVKQKVQKKRDKGNPTMTLIPLKCDENSIEYEVRCKGTSKPFSKVRVILTHELKEKGEAAVKGLLSRVLKLNIAGVENQNGREIRTTSGTQNDHVLPPSSSHHHISLQKKKKKRDNVMEKGMKSKKHEPLGRSSKGVGTKRKSFSSHYRSGVALDGRWTIWRKIVQFGVFHAEQSDDCSDQAEQPSGATRVTVPAAEIFKETTIIMGFALIILIFSPSRIHKKPDLRVGDLRFCYFVKGEGHLSRFREEPSEPYYFISVIFHVALYLCLHQVNHLVPDSRVFCEHIGLDLYCLLSHLDPNESLGIKIDQHREQYHDSGLFYLSDPSSRLALN
ncbi:hypothetical protein IGI04_015190 [Brassica rapa subsp. trilocularis]|uniref:Uncharacterized protein n=1 Tax=Brassica rapa subsp. trilocularis TaxID=1813537 RepID=A0ABQ7MPB9_BRACM|nr:hypothetical protein IGI04_015190 [Brassica rapa subsp. trilocularis]